MNLLSGYWLALVSLVVLLAGGMSATAAVVMPAESFVVERQSTKTKAADAGDESEQEEDEDEEPDCD